jgi:DNA-directed RNA polymerases I and III subunit RPAC2
MADQPKVTTNAVHSAQSKTFVLYDEDHTLGNALRHVVMRDASTDFCGYTVPHPSEKYLHLRIQTRKDTAEDALIDGAETLIKICKTVNSQFDKEFIRAQKNSKKSSGKKN